MSRLVLIAVISYFLGSIPFGYLLVRFSEEKTSASPAAATSAPPMSPANRRRSAYLTLLLDAPKDGRVTLEILLSPPFFDRTTSAIPWPQLSTCTRAICVLAALAAFRRRGTHLPDLVELSRRQRRRHWTRRVPPIVADDPCCSPLASSSSSYLSLPRRSRSARSLPQSGFPTSRWIHEYVTDPRSRSS